MANKTTFETINIDDFNHDPINQEKVQSYPPELVGRFNSFIVTAFDDSMTVEMQIRTLIKWIKENIDVTTNALDNMEAFKQDSMAFQNHVKDTLVTLINQFTDAFDDNLEVELIEVLKQWNEDGYLQSLINEYTNERIDVVETEIVDARGGKDNLGQRLDETDDKLSNINNELIDARGGKATLGERLDETDEQLAQKATKDELQQISLSYKESYATLSLLQAAYPTGDDYNHVVLSDGMIYTYKNGWVSTEIQANGTGLANGTVTESKLSSDLKNDTLLLNGEDKLLLPLEDGTFNNKNVANNKLYIQGIPILRNGSLVVNINHPEGGMVTAVLLDKITDSQFRIKHRRTLTVAPGKNSILTDIQVTGNGSEYLGVLSDGNLYVRYEQGTIKPYLFYESELAISDFTPHTVYTFSKKPLDHVGLLAFYPGVESNASIVLEGMIIDSLGEALASDKSIETGFAESNGVYEISTNSLKVYPKWQGSKWINCEDMDIIIYENIPTHPILYSIVFRDINNVFISGISNDKPLVSGYVPRSGKVAVPKNAHEVMLTNHSDTVGVTTYSYITKLDTNTIATKSFVNDEMVSLKEELDNISLNTSRVEYIKPLISNTLHIGDSITEGDYGVPLGEPNQARVKEKNYPYFMNKIFGWNTKNKGKSGYTSSLYWDDLNNGVIDLEFETGNYDIVYIMLGTNGGLTDTLESDTTITQGQTYRDYANTNTGSYCKIIEFIKESNPNTTIILCTPIYAIPEKRSKAHLEGANNVIHQIGDKYNLYVIDTYRLVNIDENNTSIYQPRDGLHLGTMGYSKLADTIGYATMINIDKDPKRFNDTILINTPF